MGASKFVGRVGGLAVALGVGAAVFTGVGVAWADDNSGSDPGPKATSQHAGGSSASQNGSRAKRAKVSAGSNSSSAEGNSAQATKVDNTVKANTFTGAAPSATAVKGSTTQSVTSVVQPVTTAVVDPTSGGNAPLPVDSPVSLALAAFARREASSAASTTNPAALTTTSANLSASSAITTTPTVTWTNGVLMGSVNAVCASCGSPLTYTVISGPNAGGKVNLNLGAFGTDPLLAGNFSYLPYATTLATTGATEQFKIRVNSTTGVVTFLEGIPLLGMVVTPVVNLLYQVPILNTLLAPIIGYSTVASFDLDPNALAAGKNATAFTDKVTSFDGTKISVNFFPSVYVANGPVPTPTPSCGAPAWPPRATPTPSARSSTAPFPVWRPFALTTVLLAQERIQRADLGSAWRVRVGRGAPVGQPAVRGPGRLVDHQLAVDARHRRRRRRQHCERTGQAWAPPSAATPPLPRSAWSACRTAAASRTSALQSIRGSGPSFRPGRGIR